MDPMQLTLAKSTDESLRALAQIKEPDCALLYACIYAAGGNLALQSAARQLEWTEDRLRRALQMLTVLIWCGTESNLRSGAKNWPTRPNSCCNAAAMQRFPAFAIISSSARVAK